MSYFDDFNADFEDDSRRNRRLFLGLILGMTGAGIACLAVCAGLVWLAVERIGEMPLVGDFASAELPAVDQETPEEKRSWVNSAFSDPPPFVVDRRPIEALFRRVTEACQSQDDAAFRKLVDAEAYWQHMKESGFITTLTRGQDRRSPDEVLEILVYPAKFDRMLVHAVTPGHSSEEVIAYVFGWEGEWISETRWWLTKHDSTWRISDWELLQIGNRNSWRDAAYFAEISGVSGHEASTNDLRSADAAVVEGDIQKAAKKLRQAASATIPDFFAAEHRLDIAFGWSRAGLALHERHEYQNASQESLDRAPGLLLGWAMAESLSGNNEHALELIDRFELAVGGGPNVDRIRGDALFAMGRFDEAAHSYVGLLDTLRGDESLLTDVARRLPADRLDAIISAVARQSDPPAAALSVAAAVSDMPDHLLAVEEFLRKHHPNSGLLDLVHGDRLRADQKFDEAAGFYVAAYEKLPPFDQDNENPQQANRNLAVFRIVTMFSDADRVVDAHQRAPDKQLAFEELSFYDSEYGLDEGDMARVAELHLQVAPDDTEALMIASDLAVQNGDLDQAVKLISQASERADGENPFPYGDRLVSTFLHADRFEDAEKWVREHPDDYAAFNALASHLEDAEEWTSILDLCDVMPVEEKYAQSTVVTHKAKALAALDRYGEAEALLVSTYRQLEGEWWQTSLLKDWRDIARSAGRPHETIPVKAGIDAYPRLISMAIDEGEFESAVRLENAWKLMGGTSKDLLPGTVDRLWLQQDYDAIVSAVRGVGFENALLAEQVTEVPDRFVRSLIRKGETKAAIKAARQAYDTSGNATLYAVACISDGDWEAAENAVFVLDDYSRSLLYVDDDAGVALRTDAAADFRRALRREITDVGGTRKAVLLLKNPLSAEEFARQIEELESDSGDFRVENVSVVPLESDADETCLLVRAREASWLISIGSDPYVDETQFADLESDVLALAISEHAAWIAIDVCQGSSRERERLHPFESAVISLAAEADPAAISVLTREGSFLIPWSDELPDMLKDNSSGASRLPNAELRWVFREPADDQTSPVVERSLREFAQAFAQRKPGEEYVVSSFIRLGEGRLPVRLKVRQIVAYPYLIEAVGTLNTELPDGLAEAMNLRPDDLLTVGGWNLLDWQRAGEGQQAAPTD